MSGNSVQIYTTAIRAALNIRRGGYGPLDLKHVEVKSSGDGGCITALVGRRVRQEKRDDSSSVWRIDLTESTSTHGHVQPMV